MFDKKHTVYHRDDAWENREPGAEYRQDMLAYQPSGQNPDPGKQQRISRRPGAGFVAAVLGVALIGGTAGGGATAWWLLSNRFPDAVSQAVPQEPLAAAPSNKVTPVSPAGDVTAVVEKAAKSVVEISLDAKVQTFLGVRDSTASGSGVIISGDGYIITNNHVVENGGSITVRTYDGQAYSAELIGTDVKTDLAVLKIESGSLSPAVFADSDSVQVGEAAVVIGNPLGTLGGTVTSGIISAMNRELTIGDQTMNLMQTSAAVNPGNSGGGLFNADGELVGIVNAKSGGTNIEGLGFAIPSNISQAVANEIIENGYVTGRTELGIQVVQVEDPRVAAYYGLDDTGVFVMEVTRPNGLKAGDRVVSINGKQIQQAEDVSDLVKSAKVGEHMRVAVVRGGESLTLDVTVAEQIPDSMKGRLPQLTGKI